MNEPFQTTQIECELDEGDVTLSQCLAALTEANVPILRYGLRRRGSTPVARFVTPEPGRARTALRELGLTPLSQPDTAGQGRAMASFDRTAVQFARGAEHLHELLHDPRSR